MLAWTATAVVAAAMMQAPARNPDLLVADFEAATWKECGWTATGDAFGTGPAHGTLPNQMRVSGFVGHGLVNSYVGGDAATGTLVSTPFTIERDLLCFRIGGGNHPNETRLELIVDGAIVRTATGFDSEHLVAASISLHEWRGKRAQIVIADRATGGWGHINVDQIVQSDQPIVAGNDDELLKEADEAVAAAAPAVADDPARPVFHLLPAAQWLNDPNGLLFHDGWYHVFFQHNPYGDDWGDMHWGHARSRDLAHWERLPIALAPSMERGEAHCFSGSAIHRDDGTPVLIYTSIGFAGRRAPEQWIAEPATPDLLHWRKPAADPAMTTALHGDPQQGGVEIMEWRDPYMFRCEGRIYVVCGGGIDVDRRRAGVVNVYRAENAELTQWKYLGILFQHPDADVHNIECPIFFKLDGKWVLITSQGQPVHWFVGNLDESTLRFTAVARGVVDSGCVYAPSVLADGIERPILWGWVQGRRVHGWRHCLSAPRRLALDANGNLRQTLISELATLRDDHVGPRDFELREGVGVPVALRGQACELDFTVAHEAATRVSLRILGPGSPPHVVDMELPARAREVTLLVDHSVVELFAAGQCRTSILDTPTPGDDQVEFTAIGGAARVTSLEIWALKSAWIAPTAGK